MPWETKATPTTNSTVSTISKHRQQPTDTPAPPFPNGAICHESILNSHTFGDFFAITYAAGHLTWKQAKAIDVAHNLVIGHGLQTALALLSHRLSLGALLRNAESAALPYASLAFQHGSTASAWQLLRNVFGIAGLRRKLTMLCLLCSTCWILALSWTVGVLWSSQAAQVLEASKGCMERHHSDT